MMRMMRRMRMMRMMMIFSMIESSAMMLCGLNDGDAH